MEEHRGLEEGVVASSLAWLPVLSIFLLLSPHLGRSRVKYKPTTIGTDEAECTSLSIHILPADFVQVEGG